MNALTETRLGFVAQACRTATGDMGPMRLACYRAAREFELLQPQFSKRNEIDEASGRARAGRRRLAACKGGQRLDLQCRGARRALENRFCVYGHAPRVRTIGDLSFRFERPPHIWDPDVCPIHTLLGWYQRPTSTPPRGYRATY
jgi:hypothetical protein